MNIIEAAKAMKEGKSVTRGTKSVKYTCIGSEIYSSEMHAEGWSKWRAAWYDGEFCSLEELLADDWEVVE